MNNSLKNWSCVLDSERTQIWTHVRLGTTFYPLKKYTNTMTISTEKKSALSILIQIISHIGSGEQNHQKLFRMFFFDNLLNFMKDSFILNFNNFSLAILNWNRTCFFNEDNQYIACRTF